MSEGSWKTAFPQFNSSQKQLSDVLTSGELPLQEYMKWAADHYKIPFLSDDFFKQANNFKLLIQNPNTQWNSHFFPINEWQGTLYVGCLEPQPLSIEKNYCFVLCSPQKMQELWEKMEQPEAEKSFFDSLSSITQDPPSTAQGSDSPFPTSKFQFEEVKSEAPQPEPTKTATQVPALSFGELTGAAEISKVVIPSAPQVGSSTKTQNPSGTPDIPEITNVALINTQLTKTFSKEFTNTKTIMPFPERSTQFTFIRTVYSQQVIQEANSKIQENTTPQDALVSAFRILKDYYKKIMWVVRDPKGYVFPIACNAFWDFTEAAWNEPIDFKTPNPFRIAKLTQKPFHGPVSPNPVSDSFFAQWTSGTYPNVMSIVPVSLQGKILGYLVACDKGEHFSQAQSLDLMTSVCNELMSTFVKIHSDLDKAS